MNSQFSEQDLQIDNFSLNFVFEKIQKENNLRVSAAISSRVEFEFKRFLKLILRENSPLAMIDKRMDELWHSFILFDLLPNSSPPGSRVLQWL
jgi:hypothetical protein